MLQHVCIQARRVGRRQAYMIVVSATAFAVEQLLAWTSATCQTGLVNYAPLTMSSYNHGQLLQILKAAELMGMSHNTLKFAGGCLTLCPDTYMRVWHSAVTTGERRIAAALNGQIQAYLTACTQDQKRELLLLAERPSIYNALEVLHRDFWSTMRTKQKILSDIVYLFQQRTSAPFKHRIVRDAAWALRQNNVRYTDLPVTLGPALLAALRQCYPQTRTSHAPASQIYPTSTTSRTVGHPVPVRSNRPRRGFGQGGVTTTYRM